MNMQQTIKIKNSTVAGKIPTADQLATAELALNLVDKKLYTKDTSENVILLNEKHPTETNGEWYIDSVNGSDTNDGKGASTAFRTIQRLFDYLSSVTRVGQSWLEIYLAAGDYTMPYMNYLNNLHESSMWIIGAGSTSTRLTWGGSWGGNYLSISGCDLRNGSSYIRCWNHSHLELSDIILRNQLQIYGGTVMITGPIKFAGIGTGQYQYGKLYICNRGYCQFGANATFTIGDDILTKDIIHVSNGAYAIFYQTDLTKFNTESGNRNTYTGQFAYISNGGELTFISGAVVPNTMFPNCTTRNTYINEYDENNLSHFGNAAGLKQPHNLATKRDVADCHPISAITGLSDALTNNSTFANIWNNSTTWNSRTMEGSGGLLFSNTDMEVSNIVSASSVSIWGKEDETGYNTGGANISRGKLRLVGEGMPEYADELTIDVSNVEVTITDNIKDAIRTALDITDSVTPITITETQYQQMITDGTLDMTATYYVILD